MPDDPRPAEPTCPRCLSPADHSPDEKVCSDNCITRHLAALAVLREQNAGLEAVLKAKEGSVGCFANKMLLAEAERDAARAALASLRAQLHELTRRTFTVAAGGDFGRGLCEGVQMLQRDITSYLLASEGDTP